MKVGVLFLEKVYGETRYVWTSPIVGISLEMIYSSFGKFGSDYDILYSDTWENEVLKEISASVLPRNKRLQGRHNVLVVNQNWKLWRIYYVWDWICEFLYETRMKIYIRLFKAGKLATKEGAIPRWQDIRLFGVKK